MEVWIIRDGEKVGPIHDFEIRRQIEMGELPASTPAWHEGSGDWKPLIEIELFRREFERVAEPEIPDEPAPEERQGPPPLPVKPAFIRRFWARWLDLSLYSVVWWLGMWAAGQDLEAAMANPWIMFFRFVPWFALEAVLIQQFATTPGKWLLGLHVINLDESRIDLGASTRRCMRVLFSGIGFGFSFLAVFCQILSLVVAKQIGTTLWDHAGRHKVTAQTLRPGRVFGVVAAYIISMVIHFAVFSPFIVKEMIRNDPSLKEQFEKLPLWNLPKRN
jgi:uncharacterized RDD family membrane protein YckC